MERKSGKEREEVKVSTREGGDNIEARCQSQASVSSSAWPSTCRIDQATIAWLNTQVARVYKETRKQK